VVIDAAVEGDHDPSSLFDQRLVAARGEVDDLQPTVNECHA
jgi:hypothetical protein